MPLFSRFELNWNLLLILKVSAKFPASSRSRCQETLNIVPSATFNEILPYCSETWELYRNDSYKYTVPRNSNKILTFTYSKLYAEDGGKFFLDVQGWCVSIFIYLHSVYSILLNLNYKASICGHD